MAKRRIYKGKWGPGLTAETIARLMGCSVRTAKLHLYRLRDSLNRTPSLEEVGELVYKYKYDKFRKRTDYKRYLRIRW